MDDEYLRWYRQMERVLRAREQLRVIAEPTSATRALIEAGEQMRALGEQGRRIIEDLSLPLSSAYAELLALSDYSGFIDTTIRLDPSLLAGRSFPGVRDMSLQSVGVHLDAMEDAQRLAVLGRSLVPAIALNGALTETYAAGVSRNHGEAAVSLESRDSLQALAAGIGQFRVAIQVGATQIDVPPALQVALDGLDQVTGAVTSVWSGIADNIDRFSSIPAPLRELPVLYAFEATRAVAMLFSDDEEVVDARPPQSLVGARAAALPAMLEKLHPKIAEKYLGVLHAMQARGPDYIAQASASARELLTFTVNRLAPDDQVLAFNPSSDRDKDGKLSRRARLHFIFRRVASSEDYAKMVLVQIELILGSWFPLNTAVHRLDPDLGQQQLESLVLQIEFALIEMLHASDLAAPI
jgi:hypothetical protein